MLLVLASGALFVSQVCVVGGGMKGLVGLLYIDVGSVSGRPGVACNLSDLALKWSCIWQLLG